MLLTTYRKRRQYGVAITTVYSGASFIWAEAVGWLLGRLGKANVLSLHGGALGQFTDHYPRRVERFLHRAEAINTPSEFLFQRFKGICPNLVIIPNGIEVCRYKSHFRKTASPKLCWLRAFHAIYRPWVAVETLGMLSVEFPGASLTMIGPDKGDGSLERCRRLAGDLGVADRLRIVGAVRKSEVPRWLAENDIFLNTTDFESFGVCVMEAAACGLCIVSTNVGELPLRWKDGEEVLLVPPGDPRAMAAAARRILTEPALAERLSRNARAKAEQFDWSVILPQWEALLREAAMSGWRGNGE
jgi:glycosyltransferase involved in cell wall biosynthesis